MKSQKDVLISIKNTIKKSEFVDVNWPVEIPEETEGESNFLWIGTSDGLIGNLDCHYEFIFHKENPKKLSLEVHIDEGKKQNLFENLKLPDFLEFKKWNYKNGRIVFVNDDFIDINDGSRITSKALNLLSKLHSSIGEDLEECILSNSLPKLASKGKKVATTKHYAPQTSKEAKTMNILHGAIQEKLRGKLKASKKYDFIDCECSFENLNYTIDLLTKLKDSQSYEIYEVKPYATAMECIREALGQLLFYKAVLEKGKYTVDKIVIVGLSDMAQFEKTYFDAMKSMLKTSIEIEYLSVNPEGLE